MADIIRFPTKPDEFAHSSALRGLNEFRVCADPIDEMPNPKRAVKIVTDALVKGGLTVVEDRASIVVVHARFSKVAQPVDHVLFHVVLRVCGMATPEHQHDAIAMCYWRTSGNFGVCQAREAVSICARALLRNSEELCQEYWRANAGA